MAQEFKIGRLRFTWSGQWEPSKFYNRDAVAQVDGKTYVCLVPNTSSSNFYTDLNRSPFPYWQIVIDGKSWIGPWTTSYSYGLGNIVLFGGVAYYCTAAHTSTVFANDISNWAEYVESSKWNLDWQPNYSYGKNDIVRYGGIIYKCIAEHTSSSFLNGLENNQSSWIVLYNGIFYVGLWQSGHRYRNNDLVKLDANIYICINGHTSSSTFGVANWSTWLPGFVYEGVWSNSMTYQPGDTVQYGGYNYVSNTENNTGNIPSTDSLNWTLFTEGYKFKQDWSFNYSYKVGDVVRQHGQLYEAIIDNSNQDPTSFSVVTTYSATGSSGAVIKVNSTAGIIQGMIVLGVGFNSIHYVESVDTNSGTVTLTESPDLSLTDGESLTFTGINYVFWKILVPGTYWTKTWASSASYSVGDIAVWQNTTYVCIKSHIASLSNRPDLDTNNSLWVFYIPHARKNALNTYGDIESYINGENTAIPIGTDTQSYALRDTGGIPTWTKINILPAVYYVSTLSGQDIPNYGKTWDQPWKTISYAANILKEGTLYLNEVQNLTENKNWITTEMIQWTLYQMQYSLNGFTPSYNLNQVKAVRDAGYIIDAITYDLSRGGNSQSVAAALSFFAFNDPSNFYNSDVKADVPYYIPMINYLGTLITAVINQSTTIDSYQEINNVSPIISRTIIIGTEPSLTQNGLSAQTVTQTLLGYIITSLSTQSTSLLPLPNSGISATIFVKTGTYSETLPIVVPENVAIWGDELRSVVVEPLVRITEPCTATTAIGNLITVASTTGLVDQMPVQFVDPNILTAIGTTYIGFGNINPGQTYYIVGSTVTSTKFSITSSTGTYSSITYSETVNKDTDGIDALFDVSPNPLGTYDISIVFGGTGYNISDTVTIVGSTVGGIDTDNDIVLTITDIDENGAITLFEAVGSSIVILSTATGSMTMYAGDCLKDMFRLRNGSGLRNLTLSGLMGTLAAPDSNAIQRPTGGSYACLDPGKDSSDTKAWIYRRSPYVQNVTAFGNGCTALKIDGTLHNGGFKSIVANDFTHIVSDGIGVWCTGPSALTEVISVFSYYGYTGYFAEAGGRIRAANGNSSYGTYGVIAEGYDVTEVPATGNIYNRSTQVQATVQQSYGTNSQLLRLDYTNAGNSYLTSTTNLLNHSNNFIGSAWGTDGNVSFSKISIAPSGIAEGWTFTGNSGGPDGSYIYQNVSIPASGATYTSLTATNISGTGGTGLNTPATFNITVTSTAYLVTVNNPGSGYAVTNQMYISGSQLGGLDVTNNCVITVTGLTGSGIQQISVSGTVPSGSEFNYTFSIYVKQGTSPNIDIQGIYSGYNTVISAIGYNLLTNTVTSTNALGGFLPTSYGVTSQQLSSTSATAGWYRLYFTLNDTTGLNTQLQIRIYPRGYNGISGNYTYFYGAQLEVTRSYSPSFYLEVVNSSKYTAYANYNITGAGTGVITVGDEIRGNSVFESRVITDNNGVTGGAGYLTASNNAQSGTVQYVQLAQSDVNTNGNYTGMRVFINSGTGAGQYGYISYYNTSNKNAYVLKESFESLQITNTNSTGGIFTLNNGYTTETLYQNQPVQFIPTYYTTGVTSTSLSQATCTIATGGTTNTLTVSSTLGMYVNMPLTFSGTVFTDVTVGYTYYLYAILDSQTIQITQELYGNVWPLNTGTGSMIINYPSNNSYLQGSTTSMIVNYPIQFTGTALGGLNVGTVYYINDVINSGNFSIAGSLVSVTVTSTNSSNNGLTVTSTSNLIPLNPIVFSAPTFGNIVDGTKYYISKILDSQTFTISSSLISVIATNTAAVSNFITVSSTSNFQVNQPIRFVGNTFGGVIAETTYYILVINDSYTFTISQTPGGGALTLTTASGSMTANTCPAAFTLSSNSGSMIGTSTSTKTQLSLGIGSMNATFSTSLFGGVSLGTTYYINSIPDSNTFTVSAVLGSGTPLTLSTKSGSMNIAEVGWDHINVGTPIASALDSSTVYYIEPRTTYSAPPFVQQVSSSTVNLSVGTYWANITYGHGYWMALPSGNSTAAYSIDGSSWTSLALPSSQTWTSIAYGNGFWIAISSGGSGLGSLVAISKSNGLGWRTTTLPSISTWSSIVYGNGTFVAIASSTNKSAYSTDYGTTWNAVTLPSTANWSGIAYGAGRFIAIASSGTTCAYSTTGTSWTASTLPSSTTWSDIAYGNNIFVAVSSTSNKTAYTFDGITWYTSDLPIAANKVSYGQGIFVAVSASSTSAWTSETGSIWKLRTVTNDGYSAISFGYTSSGNGRFVTLAGRSTGSIIYAGTRTKGRAIVTSGTITSISEWEPGSNYTLLPSVTLTDPNITTLASVTPRVGNGVLSSPTFINRGTGYNTASTLVNISGNGYSDAYQVGLTIILNNLTRLPQPGDNLTIDGVSQIYKVTSAYSVYSTVAPYLEANVSISPAMTVANATANGTAVNIRSKYSQARLTNHDFLNIGYGDFDSSNYPGYPDSGYSAISNNQVVEVNYGRVFYTSTDQDGNFKVGNLFGVQQATGIVTLSASQFGLTGLSSLSLGGIAVGGSSVTITQFSTDGSFTANSDAIIPTQKAIKTYLNSRLSQGGANTFTGQLTAGSVVVGGPNYIRSTVPNGVIGSVVKMTNKVYINGSGVDGNMAALEFFIRNGNHK